MSKARYSTLGTCTVPAMAKERMRVRAEVKAFMVEAGGLGEERV